MGDSPLGAHPYASSLPFAHRECTIAGHPDGRERTPRMHGMAAARKQAGDDGAKRGPGRPADPDLDDVKGTTLWLRPASLLWLDEAVMQAKRAKLAGALSGKFSRSSILRGALAALEEAGVDVGSCDSEEAVRRAVLGALKARR